MRINNKKPFKLKLKKAIAISNRAMPNVKGRLMLKNNMGLCLFLHKLQNFCHSLILHHCLFIHCRIINFKMTRIKISPNLVNFMKINLAVLKQLFKPEEASLTLSTNFWVNLAKCGQPKSIRLI